MIPSATMVPVFHRGSVHDESTALVVFVGVTTLGPPIHWIIFFVVDVIGLEPLINLQFHSLGLVVLDFSSLKILLEDSISWLKFIFFRVFPFSFSFALRLHLFDCCFGSFRVRVLRASTRISLSTLIWLCHMKVWGGISIYP